MQYPDKQLFWVKLKYASRKGWYIAWWYSREDGKRILGFLEDHDYGSSDNLFYGYSVDGYSDVRDWSLAVEAWRPLNAPDETLRVERGSDAPRA